MEFLNTFESILYFGKIVKINLVFMKNYSFSVLFCEFHRKTVLQEKRQHSLKQQQNECYFGNISCSSQEKIDKKHEKSLKNALFACFSSKSRNSSKT